MSDRPPAAAMPELLARRSLDVLLIALVLGVAAVVVIWLLDVPGSRLGVFGATALAIVLYLVLALTRLRAVARQVRDRGDALPRETVVVEVTDVLPVRRTPPLLLQRSADGLRFTRLSDAAQTATLRRPVIQTIEVTPFPVGLMLTLTDGSRVRLRTLSSRLSPRRADLEVLRGWLVTGSRFPAELGTASFGPGARP